jgi:presequence protease
VDANNPDLKINQEINGFLIKRIVALDSIVSFFYELEHLRTGAKYIHISNSDKENTFGVALKTVPTDSTGVAHILEHTVLCGSDKYPVRDPFFSMLKRSLSTFMNAFTSSDWTMYPFCTQNRKDFYNLMDVYLDAVFFPKIELLSFRQEGHRMEVESHPESSDSQNIVYKGVVYNEMKGAMSSPDQVLARSLLNALYPSTTYRHNSGGDPAVIPKLTYEQLKAFHRHHYHPSNAFFYTYGSLPLTDHLSFIQRKILDHFDRIDPQTAVPSQPRWAQPKNVTYTYPLGKNEDPSKKSQVTIGWVTADIKETFEVLTLILIEQILLGNSASPLRKALIDSGLGAALCDATGFSPDSRDTMFACGLKDVQSSDSEKIVSIVFDTLADLVENGIDRQLIESAIHQIEFHRKEVTNHPYPYGIKLLLIFSGTWFHGGDPEKMFQFDEDIELIRGKLDKEPFFENQIRKYFLNNLHRVCLTLAPDQSLEEKENRRVSEELRRIQDNMTPGELARIVDDAEALSKLQETKEDISVLPTLALEDIPPEVQVVSGTVLEDNRDVISYTQPTGGIFYFSAAVGTGALPRKILSLVPFFCNSFSRIGTDVRDYAEMAKRIAQFTGGIGLSANARKPFEDHGNCVPFITLNGKCLDRNIPQLFEIIEELVCRHNFSDLNRLKNLLLEYRAGLESMVVQNGHRLAMSLSSRNFSTADALNESWHGIHQLLTIKDLTQDLTDDRLAALAADLASIGKVLFSRHNLKAAIIGEKSSVDNASSRLQSLYGGLSEENPEAFLLPENGHDKNIPKEGWSTTSAVSFVACTFKTVTLSHEDAPALAVISKLLRSLYLHREIREKGGAYGGLALYNAENGLFSFASYRDPHIVSTLEVYQNAMAFVRSGNYQDEDIKESILQVCSDIDKPDPPGPAARKAFIRKIVSLPDDARIQFKQKLLSLSRDHVRQIAEKYFQPDVAKRAVAVISSEQKLIAANDKLKHQPLELHKI